MADLKLITPSRRATLLGAVAMASATVAVSGSAKASQISPALQKAFDEWKVLRAVEIKMDEKCTEAEDRCKALIPECPEDLLRENTRHGLGWTYVGEFRSVPFAGGKEEYATPAGLERVLRDISEKLNSGSSKDPEWLSDRKLATERLLTLSRDYEAAIAAADTMSGIDAAADDVNEAQCAAHSAFVRFTRIRPKTMAEVQLQAAQVAEWSEEGDILEEFVLDWMKSLAQLVS